MGLDPVEDCFMRKDGLQCAVMCAEPCTFLLCRALFRLSGARTHARTLDSDLLPCDACLVV